MEQQRANLALGIESVEVKSDYAATLRTIQADPRYLRNIAWGEPRHGHPEGSIAAHIEHLEQNLERLKKHLSEVECEQLRLLIHVHDTFKPEAAAGAWISDPASHASLARKFLAEFCEDQQLLAIVQNHDEPYALWRHYQHKGNVNEARWAALLSGIEKWDLFLAFNIIDGCTVGKGREPLHWWLNEIQPHVETRFTSAHILHPE